MRRNLVEKRGKIEQMDRSFDLKFWRAQPAKARFEASWELATHYLKVKGNDVRQFRLQQATKKFGKQNKDDS